MGLRYYKQFGSNPFIDLPFNKNRVYCIVQTTSGCTIYIPASNQLEARLRKKGAEEWLSDNTTTTTEGIT